MLPFFEPTISFSSKTPLHGENYSKDEQFLNCLNCLPTHICELSGLDKELIVSTEPKTGVDITRLIDRHDLHVYSRRKPLGVEANPPIQQHN